MWYDFQIEDKSLLFLYMFTITISNVCLVERWKLTLPHIFPRNV